MTALPYVVAGVALAWWIDCMSAAVAWAALLPNMGAW